MYDVLNVCLEVVTGVTDEVVQRLGIIDVGRYLFHIPVVKNVKYNQLF